MKLLSTWTGVLIIVLLAIAMAAVSLIQYAHGQTPTAIASVIGLIAVAVLLARRVARRKNLPPPTL
jgi:membrane protein implicated in regulation of membrane protease activity